MFRYLALIWNARDRAHTDAAHEMRMRVAGSQWGEVLCGEGVNVYCAGAASGSGDVCLLAEGCGVILGTVFARQRTLPRSDARIENPVGVAETDRILASAGRRLITAHWGNFLAILIDRMSRRVRVVRDPLGRLPCFCVCVQGVTVLFSSVSDCVDFQIARLSINGSYLARRVALGIGGSDETGLEGVSELRGGTCTEYCAGNVSTFTYWEPRTVLASAALEHTEHALAQLRATTRACVHAWAACHASILHRLSGGLDSSIVLACLNDAPRRPALTCLTYFRPDGRSDERPWARLARGGIPCTHVEYARHPNLDFARLQRLRPLAYPPADFSFLEVGSIERALALEYRASAVFSGDGGDAVFGSFGARFAVGDFVRRHGVRPALLRIASHVALQENRLIWSVVVEGIRNGLGASKSVEPSQLREARRLVSDDVFAAGVADRARHRHPWLQPNEVPSSTASMLSFAVANDAYYDPLLDSSENAPEHVAPLLSQPLVELCLRIPTYVLFDAGRDRGLARRAFAREVPREILERHWKDRVQGFLEEILHCNREALRELLLDGVLVKERLLDRRRIERSLSGSIAANEAHVGEIMDHAVTEGWVRSWLARSAGRAVA